MLIDCDTCTVRGQGCDDCVVTVLLGAPPGWRGSDPTVVPLSRRTTTAGGPAARRSLGAAARTAAGPAAHAETCPATETGDRAAAGGDAPGHTTTGRDVPRIDSGAADPWTVVELDEVERRAVQALADFGLVPPLRHQDASTPGDRHVS